MRNKKIVSIAVIVLILLGGIGFWYWSQKRVQGPMSPAPVGGEEQGAAAETVIEQDGLGAEVFNKTKNPLANELPETNPFQVNTNPFK